MKSKNRVISVLFLPYNNNKTEQEGGGGGEPSNFTALKEGGEERAPFTSIC